MYAKLYECLGLVILFYSLEHEPIHVHGKYQETESKAILLFENGKFVGVEIEKVKGKKPLDAKNTKKLIAIVEKYRDDIVRKWVDFFIYNIQITPEIITKKID